MGIAGAIIGAGVIGAGASIVTGNKAANAQKEAADQSIGLQKYMYDTTRGDYAPQREYGYGALGKLAGMYGVQRTNADGTAATGGTASTEPYGGFETSPGYQFRVDEATKAIERSAAARGALRSGATMDALQRRVQGVASDEYGRYADRLAQIAGIGQSAQGTTAQAGQNYANSASQAYTNAGNARASAYTNTGNAINSGVQNVASAYLYGKGYGGDYGSGGFSWGSGSSLPTGIY